MKEAIGDDKHARLDKSITLDHDFRNARGGTSRVDSKSDNSKGFDSMDADKSDDIDDENDNVDFEADRLENESDSNIQPCHVSIEALPNMDDFLVRHDGRQSRSCAARGRQATANLFGAKSVDNLFGQGGSANLATFWTKESLFAEALGAVLGDERFGTANLASALSATTGFYGYEPTTYHEAMNCKDKSEWKQACWTRTTQRFHLG